MTTYFYTLRSAGLDVEGSVRADDRAQAWALVDEIRRMREGLGHVEFTDVSVLTEAELED
jgi:hypothetical protein